MPAASAAPQPTACWGRVALLQERVLLADQAEALQKAARPAQSGANVRKIAITGIIGKFPVRMNTQPITLIGH